MLVTLHSWPVNILFQMPARAALQQTLILLYNFSCALCFILLVAEILSTNTSHVHFLSIYRLLKFFWMKIHLLQLSEITPS